jgi:uncharacterized protein (DUF362 family)
MKSNLDVAISTKASYPNEAPFNPGIKYPEYPFEEISKTPNSVYELVRKNFSLLEYDKENYGTKNWNPLKEIVKPGTTVFIKPNLVDHKHRFNENIWCVITHPSVIRAVADYVAIALKGSGKIIIGDNPHVDTNFDKLSAIMNFKELKDFYKKNFGIECEVVDLRYYQVSNLKYYGFKEGREKLSGDPKGFSKINLGKKSLLSKINFFLLRGTYTDRLETIRHHMFHLHQYFISNSILQADTYISIPKLKTHAKVGATLNIKGLVGTISNKNTLVHWRIGFPKFGGDEYPNPKQISDYFKLYWQHLLIDILPEKMYFRLRNYFNKTKLGKAYNFFIDIEYQKLKMLRGAWEGNDTTWRMAADIYNIFVNDLTGFRKANNYNSKFFSVIDGVIAGDTDGPHFPCEVNSGVILSGQNFLSIDAAAVRLMDLDFNMIQYLKTLMEQDSVSPADIRIISTDFNTKTFWDKETRHLLLKPPHRWEKLSIHDIKPTKSFLPKSN